MISELFKYLSTLYWCTFGSVCLDLSSFIYIRWRNHILEIHVVALFSPLMDQLYSQWGQLDSFVTIAENCSERLYFSLLPIAARKCVCVRAHVRACMRVCTCVCVHVWSGGGCLLIAHHRNFPAEEHLGCSCRYMLQKSLAGGDSHGVNVSLPYPKLEDGTQVCCPIGFDL